MMKMDSVSWHPTKPQFCCHTSSTLCSTLFHHPLPQSSFRPLYRSTSTTSPVTLFHSKPSQILRWKTKSLPVVGRFRFSCAASRGGIYGDFKFDDEYQEDPFWLQFCKEAVRGLKLLFTFLIEQPGQLKYIEWPSFKDTLRTATLTLVLVAMLVVALSSIDSALSFVLAFLLRRPG